MVMSTLTSDNPVAPARSPASGDMIATMPGMVANSPMLAESRLRTANA